MRLSNHFYGVALLALLMVWPQTCFDLLPNLIQKELARGDPWERAAAESAGLTVAEKRAQDAAKKAIATTDPKAMDAAVEALPLDPTYRYQRAALLFAKNDPNWKNDIAVADGMAERDEQKEGRKPQEVEFWAAKNRTDALLLVMQGTQRNTPEWQRINGMYCASFLDLRQLSVQGQSDPTTGVAVAAFPGDTC